MNNEIQTEQATAAGRPCDYVLRVTDNQPKPLSRDMFLSLIGGMDVQMTCEEIRLHKPGAETLKRNLPGVCWQSHFGGQLRTDKNALATGYYCLDVDIHHEPHFKTLCETEGYEAAYRWAEKEARDRAERWATMAEAEVSGGSMEAGRELDIVAVHVSPSATGVHVVAMCNPVCSSIAEDQARLAQLLGTSYDAVCKDPARVFFITPKSDWTYLDMDTIFGY